MFTCPYQAIQGIWGQYMLTSRSYISARWTNILAAQMKSMMCARRMAGSQELSNDKLQRVAAAYAGLSSAHQ